jgi:hypothetical protein
MRRRRGRLWALAAGGIGVAVTFAYIGIIVSQGDTPWVPMTFFALAMALASTAALAAELISNVVTGRRLLVFSTVVFGVVGMLGIFTIGVPLLVAAALAGVGAIRLDDPPTLPQESQQT